MARSRRGLMRTAVTRIGIVFGFVAAFVVGGGQAANAAGPSTGALCPAAVAAPPELPGEFVIADFVLFTDDAGVVWAKLFPQTPWGAMPPSEWFSDYVQVVIADQTGAPQPTVIGFQTHAGVSETFSFIGTGPGPLIEGYIMNDGALLFNTAVVHAGGPLDVNLSGGFLPTENGTFQNHAFDVTVAASEIATSDDPLHFDDEFPVYDLSTGTPVEPPVVVVETTVPAATATTQPEVTTTTTPPSTQERPRSTTTARGETCWWCWGIVLLFVSFLVCVIWTRMKSFEWWTCWLPWFLVIFAWVPFLFAGLWWWRPAWWWVPLLAWGPLILGYAWYWARRRTWWRPWHWYLIGGYLAALLVVSLVVGAPEWGLLFPLFWLPWVGFYVWYRARRQPWWHNAMYLVFAAYVLWIFVWVVWLTLWWAWWLPIAFVAVVGWWFVRHKYSWKLLVSPKWCWLVPFALLPFFAWWIPLWAPWWCFVVALFFAESLLCSAFTHFKAESWWTWWLPAFLVVFLWVPFWLAGLWFFRPNWWAWSLVPWYLLILAGTFWWARRRSWWRPWMWWPVFGYLAAASLLCIVVGDPEWGLLFPVFWLPWAALYVWYRARRQSWWQPWLALLFLGFAVWLGVWVGWLTPWWGWWFPIVFVAIGGWWFLAHGYNAITVRHKLCWILPWSALPWLCYMVALECLVVT